jgi:PAS domain S-box-containing protein
MIDLTRRLLAGPRFTDEEQTRTARLLYITLMVAFTASGLNIVLELSLTNVIENFLVLYVAFELVVLGLLWLVWRGYVRTTAWLICTLLWCIIVGFAFRSQGLLNPIFSASICVIVAAGLLLGGRAALLFMTMSMLVSIFLLSQPGYPTSIGNIPVSMAWADYVSIALFITLLAVVWANATRDALKRGRENQQALFEHNLALQREIVERHQVEAALRETERALRESEQRFRVALAAAPIRVANLDRDLRYTWVYNPHWYEAEEMIGKTDADLLAPQSAAIAQRIKQQVLDSGIGQRDEIEIEVKGEVRYIDITVEPVRDLSGQITGLTTASYNITEQKRAQQEAFQNELLRVEVEKSKRLAQLKDSFVTMILHEFRTPLTIIHSSKELLERYRDRLTEERRAEHLSKIGLQINHMVDMLDNILTLSKASAGMLDFHPQSVDIAAFCRSVFDEFTARHAGERQFVFKCADSCNQSAMLDENLLRPALMNLLSNAAKYSPSGSRIQFEALCSPTEVVLKVTDEGMGIPVEDHERLFEPFHRALNARDLGGTGLGLAIVKNNLDTHGGTISFESREGIGTTFIVRLPFHLPDALSKSA